MKNEPHDRRVEEFLRLACSLGLWSKPSRLGAYCSYLFSEVPLAGTRMLDIGGGTGVFSLYAAAAGASKVTCLEPEADGSRPGMLERFAKARTELGLPNVDILPQTFQEYAEEPGHYDVVLLHASINHLNERACVELRRSQEARETYRSLFEKIANCTAPGGHVILTDATPANLWAVLHIRNPFAPTIEWEKHQVPSLWAEMGEESGLRRCCLRWTTPNSLGPVGRLLLGNALGAFLTLGLFRLHLRKPPS